MSPFLVILLIVAMVLTALSLFGGLFVMARGRPGDARVSNRFMQARIVMQGIAILLFVLVMLLR
jgi:flagellar basal body-associated protein FliL